eukprot:SAG31_NODE_9767_length_1230_cov_1.596817_2_plen_151_part_00
MGRPTGTSRAASCWPPTSSHTAVARSAAEALLPTPSNRSVPNSLQQRPLPCRPVSATAALRPRGRQAGRQVGRRAEPERRAQLQLDWRPGLHAEEEVGERWCWRFWRQAGTQVPGQRMRHPAERRPPCPLRKVQTRCLPGAHVPDRPRLR